jgi:hypothetical protein
MSKLFIVRGGVHQGKYVALASRPVGTRKYVWANLKSKAVVLTYSQARGVARRYGGEVVAL